MSGPETASRWRAAAAATLLLLAGAVLGVAVDRTWIRSRPGSAVPVLSVDDLARSLDLDASTRRRVSALVDSLDSEIVRAARAGPDSLRRNAMRARRRIEAVLPPGRVPGFRRWMRTHHRAMMRQLHGEGERPGPGGMHRPGMGPGRMAPGDRSGQGPDEP